MGMRRSSHRHLTPNGKFFPLPLRLDLLAQDLCKCLCHHKDAPNPHKHIKCQCVPTYSVDGHALSVVQLEGDEQEV